MPDNIAVSSIDDSDRLRPVDPDRAALIAASIEAGRLEQPLVVRPAGAGYKLTAGAHRLAAIRLLGWEYLEIGSQVIVREQDDLTARLSEIDENLARHELNALDRAMFLAERKRVYLEIARVHAKGGDRKSTKFKAEINSATCGIDFSVRFSAEAAKRLGLSEDTVSRALRIAERLDPHAIVAIRGSMVERNQQELLALAELEPEMQRAAAKSLSEGHTKTVRQARVAIGLDEAPSDDPQGRLYAEIKARLVKCDLATLKAIAADLKKETARKAKEGAAQ